MAVEYGSLPFNEAIKFFLAKLSIPTRRWADIMGALHNDAFVVAGAMDADLLMDLRAAVEKAITDGTTLADFRKDFDAAVVKAGWQYKGTRSWRTNLIYQTNMDTSYAAGRYAQMTDPDVLSLRPYWQYHHSPISRIPREQHMSWDGLILPANDPWWDTHYPPNGWGCKCYVTTLGPRDMKRLKKDGPDTAPEVKYYEWTDRATGKTYQVPEGIAPGWDYAPGKKDVTADLSGYPDELKRHIEQRKNGR